MNKKIFGLFLFPVLLAGCSSVVTNLTPSTYPRDPSGQYRVEAEWRSSREVIRDGSINPKVVVETSMYPMRPVPLVKDRWEGYIPIPPDQDRIYYHYKFDFQVNSVSQPHADSMLSREYTLKIGPPK